MPTSTPTQTAPSAAPPPEFPPLELERRPRVITEQAAHYLNRRPQTLRAWACLENGPLRPTRIHGRLSWGMAEIRELLGVQ
ncbi:hypothetical protein [Simplicispira psychrophila]|uniref:hypothetical protein n=1 Tax=Simplicispira psychrophila TaxID=80882 RepID=UPI000569DCA1|nr:hypothetical protein [Simplicispira psychrophila]